MADKTSVCSSCGQTFRGTLAWMVHERTHVAERIYKCSPCGRKYPCHSDLLVHQKSHAGENPHRCASDGVKGQNAPLPPHQGSRLAEKFGFESSDGAEGLGVSAQEAQPGALLQQALGDPSLPGPPGPHGEDGERVSSGGRSCLVALRPFGGLREMPVIILTTTIVEVGRPSPLAEARAASSGAGEVPETREIPQPGMRPPSPLSGAGIFSGGMDLSSLEEDCQRATIRGEEQLAKKGSNRIDSNSLRDLWTDSRNPVDSTKW